MRGVVKSKATDEARRPAKIASGRRPRKFRASDKVAFKRTPSLERQTGLDQAVAALRDRFACVGYAVPEKIRYSIGWPKRRASCGAIGECWPASASSDAHREMFISPELTDGLTIIAVQAHELVHAICGAPGHGPEFRRCALAVGLKGPMRATAPGDDFIAWVETLFKRIGPYPAGYLTHSPMEGTRLLKCSCETCGYLARVTRKWVDDAGPPICPTDQIPMRAER
jgi:hypothetical protein